MERVPGTEKRRGKEENEGRKGRENGEGMRRTKRRKKTYDSSRMTSILSKHTSYEKEKLAQAQKP